MLAAISLVLLSQGSPLKLTQGAVITRSGSVAKERVLMSAADRDAALRIGADGITVDFAGSAISSNLTDQAAFTGTGLLIEGRKNVTIRNARFDGFRWNVRIVDCENVRLENCTLDRSRAIRMMTPAGRVIDHFVDIRNIEVWRTYGAGILIENSRGCTVLRTKASQAQNGILLIGSNRNTVEQCDFSFNSGWGIGLARSSDNEIVWNHADFVNRPWGGGWGGDSSGVAVVDGSHRNYFVGNSFTHGGDGFFLTDRVNGGFDRATGVFKFEGSSNNNVIAYNDGSWSPANAFEGTFSFGNIYYRNWCNDSRYGFWLGYSSDSLISRNEIWRSTADAIAVEQGANNKIEFNEIVNTGLSAVHLWSGDRPEHATRPSTRNVILGNLIRNAESAYSLERSTETTLAGNQVHGAKLPENVQTSTAATSSTTAFERSPEHSKVMSLLARRPAGWLYYREMGRPLGLKWVEPEEFAPRDFRNDIVAWRRVNESELEIEGVRPQPVSFKHSPKVALVPAAGNRAAWFVKPALPEDGIGGFFDPQIVATSAGRSQQINATLFSARWQVRYYHWDKDALKPEDTAGWNRLFASEPVHQSQQNQIAGDFSFKPQATGLRTEYWAFEAITQVRLEAGTYEFNALPDDGLQVWAGDQKVIDAWRSTPGNLSGRVSLPAGVHTIRVRFMQTWGHTYLQFAFRKV